MNDVRSASSLSVSFPLFLCPVYSFSWLNQREREGGRTFDCVIYIVFISIRCWLHLCIFEREREKKEEEADKKERRRQYLFLNTHHCAMMEKQEKKKIPVLTVNSSNSIFKPWEPPCWYSWHMEGWLIIVIFFRMYIWREFSLGKMI